jgi:hypothetical protein
MIAGDVGSYSASTEEKIYSNWHYVLEEVIQDIIVPIVAQTSVRLVISYSLIVLVKSLHLQGIAPTLLLLRAALRSKTTEITNSKGFVSPRQHFSVPDLRNAQGSEGMARNAYLHSMVIDIRPLPEVQRV